ncbi:MAG TPA: hypothetical protein VGS07_01985 [Thermoanaerobaculia bacterium]|jgi:hypothetical protein|nr:hypothetical protein [Thermoanaerobaculia bacterium]
MMIREFHSKISGDESSFLFQILRRLSLLEDLASFSDVQAAASWYTWPPDSSPAGPALVAAGA